MLLVDRTWQSTTTYKYGFNGQEQDDEIYGNGNLNTAEFWEYDTRLAKRWNVDYKNNYDLSGYVVFSNNPIIMIDPYGDDDYYNEFGQYLYTDTKTSNDIRLITQEQWDLINANYSSQIKDASTSYLDLIIELENNSRLVTINFTGEDLLRLWQDSHPELPIGEYEPSGNYRHEEAALIVFDTEKAEIRLERQKNYPQAPNTYKSSSNAITSFIKDGRKIPISNGDKNNIVIGQVHTHPNKDGDNGMTFYRAPYDGTQMRSGESADLNLASEFNIPVYQIDESNIDRQTGYPYQGTKDNICTFDEAVGDCFDISRDALKVGAVE
ncbi:MAG: hypothetical protein WAT43_08120 [Chitinophagales bacterium]